MTTVTEVAKPQRLQMLWALPLAVYALSRLVQLAFVWWMADNGEIRSRLTAWDGGHFISVAKDGYPTGYTFNNEGVLVGNGLAFFPGYPMTVRLTHFLTGLEYATAAITVAWISGAFAAMGLYALGTRLYDERVGLALTVLFCTQPMSMVLSMGYSESLFVALVVGMFLFAHREDWLLAGLFGLGAALSRPTGAAAGVALAVAALIAVYRRRKGESEVPVWKPITAAVVALAGAPGYLLWVGLRLSDLRAWFKIQTAGWGTTFDYGKSCFEFVKSALQTGDGWMQVAVAWLIIVVVVLAGFAVAKRVWWPLTTYGLIALVLVLGQAGYYHSKPRLLVPVLLFLVPPAIAIGKANPRSAAVVLTVVGAFGLWFGSYLITVWHYAI